MKSFKIMPEKESSTENAKDEAVVPKTVGGFVEKEAQSKALVQFKEVVKKAAIVGSEENNADLWKYFAVFLDRILFLVNLLAVLVLLTFFIWVITRRSDL